MTAKPFTRFGGFGHDNLGAEGRKSHPDYRACDAEIGFGCRNRCDCSLKVWRTSNLKQRRAGGFFFFTTRWREKLAVGRPINQDLPSVDPTACPAVPSGR
ncbi:hypothetical protein [Stieleria maiorica]|uniref:hypothetical protein n=1 Tax=Stieleria maiorica TaxID=2795974 RepID=UPI0011CB8C6A|nr:hypothetical protein [Stieleria maiorica]